MCKVYNASGHPAVIDGRHSEQEALEEFQSTFWSKHKDHARDWCTYKEFADYYEDVSALIKSDDYFIQLMQGTWTLDRRGATDLQQRPRPG